MDIQEQVTELRGMGVEFIDTVTGGGIEVGFDFLENVLPTPVFEFSFPNIKIREGVRSRSSPPPLYRARQLPLSNRAQSLKEGL